MSPKPSMPFCPTNIHTSLKRTFWTRALPSEVNSALALSDSLRTIMKYTIVKYVLLQTVWYRLRAAGCVLQVACYRLCATGCALQAARYRLCATGCALQVACYRRRATGCVLQAACYRLRAAGYRLCSADCVLQAVCYRLMKYFK